MCDRKWTNQKNRERKSPTGSDKNSELKTEIDRNRMNVSEMREREREKEREREGQTDRDRQTYKQRCRRTRQEGQILMKETV